MQRSSIDHAFQLLENTKTKPGATGRGLSLFFAALKIIRLTFDDLDRLVSALTSGGLRDPIVQNWVGLILQRSWDGIDPDSERSVRSSSPKGRRARHSHIRTGCGMRRPIFISLTVEEQIQNLPEDLQTLWHEPNREQKTILDTHRRAPATAGTWTSICAC